MTNSFRIEATGTEADACKMIAKRQLFGIQKYGTTVRGNPLTHRQWLQHAAEEAADMLVYLLRAIEEIDKQGDDLK